MGDGCIDMPALNDTRRVVRLAMVMDEVRRIARAYRYDTLDQVRGCISDKEFCICGGVAVHGETYSLYRQLVLAKRDVDAYAQRGIFPAAAAIKRSFKLYEFYPSDNEDLSTVEVSGVSTKDRIRLKRVAFVLKRFRRCIRAHKDALNTPEAAQSFAEVQLSKDDFVACGGHRTVSSKHTYNFYRQIVIACRDMRVILEKGRHCKADLRGKPVAQIQCISSEEEEEEDVDTLDAEKTGATRCVSEDISDDEEADEEADNAGHAHDDADDDDDDDYNHHS